MKAKKLSPGTWRQIAGDIDPGKYGGIIARWEGSALCLVEFQPVRESVSDREAVEIGYPYWTSGAHFEPEDLALDARDAKSALESFGVGSDLDKMTPENRAYTIGEALLRYGRGEPEESGFGPDVLPTVVYWWHGRGGKQSFSEEDREFRALLREHSK